MLITDSTRWCSRSTCNNTTTYNNGHWPSDADAESLDVSFRGGYGSFIDTTIELIANSRQLPVPAKPEIVDETCMTCAFTNKHHVNLCHECAHELMEWLGVPKVDVTKMHSHHSAYIEAHPDHFGWDYDRRAGEQESVGRTS